MQPKQQRQQTSQQPGQSSGDSDVSPPWRSTAAGVQGDAPRGKASQADTQSVAAATAMLRTAVEQGWSDLVPQLELRLQAALKE